MSKQRQARGVFVMILGGAFAALAGCELAVDFDRSKIPADSTDAGALDVSVPNDSSSGDAGGAGDSGNIDAGTAVDASFDGSTFDASFDSSFDSSFDANDQ